jgi:hypothetical protein
MMHLQNLTQYPRYFFALLLYEGFPVSDINLYILNTIEENAFMNFSSYEGLHGYAVVQQIVCDAVRHNHQQVRDKLRCSPLKAERFDVSYYAIVGMIDGVPYFLLNPKLTFNNFQKPSFLQRLVRTLRMGENACKWSQIPSENSFLVSEPTARTIQSEIRKSEKKVFWKQTQNIKIVSVNHDVMNNLLS